jgi:hypothetical protein
LWGAAVLPIVGDGFGCRFAQLNLGAHFLDLRGLLFELGRENFHPFLLLRDRWLQLWNARPFFVDFFVLFEELVGGADSESA